MFGKFSHCGKGWAGILTISLSLFQVWIAQRKVSHIILKKKMLIIINQMTENFALLGFGAYWNKIYHSLWLIKMI